MSSVIGFGQISHNGLHDEDSAYPWNLASSITIADVGKAVSVDVSAPAQAKLCVDGEIILGRLEVVETRTIEGINVGTVAMEGGFTLPIDTVNSITAPAVGDSVQGSALPGTVKKLAAAQGRANIVTAVATDGSSCTVIFL